MGVFSHHASCPKCGSRDNRAVYSDGGSWCFGCGGSTPSAISGFVTQQEEEKTWALPTDLTQDFPPDVIKYANQFTITPATLIRCSYYYSPHGRRIWRLLYSDFPRSVRTNDRNSADAAEAKSTSSKSWTGPKSLFYGSKSGIYAIYEETPSGVKHLVLTEDSFSSLVVGTVVPSMPLFGTSIHMDKIATLAKVYIHVTVWLDHDKFKEAWEIAMRFKWLGCRTSVILTKLDPKYYSKQEIIGYLKL